jgi:hypothetical protein
MSTKEAGSSNVPIVAGLGGLTVNAGFEPSHASQPATVFGTPVTR